eukprot:1542353-Rhodomonas_salina.2
MTPVDEMEVTLNAPAPDVSSTTWLPSSRTTKPGIGNSSVSPTVRGTEVRKAKSKYVIPGSDLVRRGMCFTCTAGFVSSQSSADTTKGLVPYHPTRVCTETVPLPPEMLRSRYWFSSTLPCHRMLTVSFASIGRATCNRRNVPFACHIP